MVDTTEEVERFCARWPNVFVVLFIREFPPGARFDYRGKEYVVHGYRCCPVSNLAFVVTDEDNKTFSVRHLLRVNGMFPKRK